MIDLIEKLGIKNERIQKIKNIKEKVLEKGVILRRQDKEIRVRLQSQPP